MTQPSTPATDELTVDDDCASIHRAAMDHVQGWYEGDAERMARAPAQQGIAGEHAGLH
jgi:hypothetical protein